MKDNFSTESDKYVQYRPSYPWALFDYLATITSGFENAWDCATGNGQAAGNLARMFAHVYATDISKAQLDHAITLPNIHYSLQPAESTRFKDDFFDLITVAQAVHWFNFGAFYNEVKRTARRHAIIAIIGYGKLVISPELDRLIDQLYTTIIGKYWDMERKYVDEGYRTIPFPFEEIPAPQLSNANEWTLEHLMGYLHTWSAVKHYKMEHGSDPVALIANDLKAHWGQAEKRMVHFPLLLRIGRIGPLKGSAVV